MIVITNPDQVERALAQLKDEQYFAFDTEFVRRESFFPRPCLLQFATDKIAFALDIIVLKEHQDWQMAKTAITEFFQNTKANVVIHAGWQDMETLSHNFAVPSKIFDTQLAARFLGFEGTPSYGTLAKLYLNMEVNKELQFSRWDQRPLSEEHIEYAIKDVIYLYQLHPILLEKLNSCNKLAWFTEEMKSVCRAATHIRQNNSAELKPLMHHFETIEEAETCYAILRAREITAREVDLGKKRLISMDEIEKRCAHSYIDPYRLIVMPAHQQRFLDNVAKVQANRNEWEDIVAYRWSKKFQPKTTLKKERSFLELKDLLMKTAEELEIGVDLIAGLREIVKLIQKKPSKLYYGWRYEVFGKKAMELA